MLPYCTKQNLKTLNQNVILVKFFHQFKGEKVWINSY